MKSSISSKGQITVPIELREKLGLLPGTAVRFELRDGEAVLYRRRTVYIRSIVSTGD